MVAVALIITAAALRIWPLHALESRIAWLTFYPAVTIAALYGGIFAGLTGAVLACLIIFFLWPVLSPTPFIKDYADWLGMAVFFLNCTMISGVAEAMRRAKTRAKKAQEEAEAANKAKSNFLASMSHELRTPLNAILGFSSLMRNDSSIPEEQRKTLDIINRSGEHLLNLINDVLDMAKVESGRMSIDIAPIDLGEMVRDITDLMSMRAEEKNLKLLLDQSSNFPRFVRTDGIKLRQMLINLVGNAVKYTEKGSIILRLSSRPAEAIDSQLLIIEVEDTGIGISAEDQSRIFSPFVQVDTHGLQKGTGLGLAITKQYVEFMGGRISLVSAQGRGSIFRVELPVIKAEEGDEITDTAKKNRKVLGLAPGQPEFRILVVEDEVVNWILLQRLIENAGLKVRLAKNGAEGIGVFEAWRPHFIWMDIRMDIMDGLEATRRIRKLDGGSEVKIVALTASVFKEERDNILAAGADDFIRKPYRPEEIYECMERHLKVKFLYEDALPDSGNKTAADLSYESLAALPPELKIELSDAVVSLEAARINEVIGRISELNPELGKTLLYYADRLSYTKILQTLHK